MQSHLLPTPTPSPTSPTPPLQTRQWVLNFLLQLSPDTPSRPPEYPDPPTDRLRGMIYAAVCQRLAYLAKLSREAHQKAHHLARISTDLIGYLFPLHSYDLQVDICVKTVLFNLLLSDKDAVRNFDALSVLAATNSSLLSGVDTNSVNFLVKEAGFIPSSCKEASSSSSQKDGFGPICEARVQMALMESIISKVIQARCSKSHNGGANRGSTQKESGELDIDCLLKILPNWIFPADEFDETEYGAVYLPATENFAAFTKAITTISTACNPSSPQEVKLQPAIKDALSHYTTLKTTFQPHPQLWKFANAYLQGFISSNLIGNEAFKQLFTNNNYKAALREEWRRRRTNSFSYRRRMSAVLDVSEIEIGDEEETTARSEGVRRRSIIEEYDSWEFLR
ncbi:hypothetical protein TWF730_008097 [Orbilia blumenaviensis]|uniref:Uncharacterized protein n=1 Tax=Orbilia blumenaviensis TaxID=1796055 RepID=A0AAV9VAC3_9PEZI